jgi:hypothetical protein
MYITLSLCIIKHDAMKTYYERTHSKLLPYLEVSGHLHAPASLLQGERAHGSHWI